MILDRYEIFTTCIILKILSVKYSVYIDLQSSSDVIKHELKLSTLQKYLYFMYFIHDSA